MLAPCMPRAKSRRGIKFTPNKEDTPNGRLCWIVWVAVDRNEEGSYYAGATACEMLVDTEARSEAGKFSLIT